MVFFPEMHKSCVVANLGANGDSSPVADPGFPVGGRRLLGGTPTSDANAFQKRKNWVPLWGGGRAPAAPPGFATAVRDSRC